MKIVDIDILIDHFHSNTAAHAFLESLLNSDEQIGRQGAASLKKFRRSHRIDFGDALIAATAYVHGATVATRNVRHYPMEDVEVLVPYERGS